MTDPAIEGMREIDVLFDGPPGPVAGRFVEVEDAATGRSIGIGDWIPPSLDGYWRLRFRVRALDAEAKLLEAHKALDACHAAYAPTAEAAQLLSVHLVEAHGADLYGKPHSETIRCAHAKLAAMQRVVEAAVAYFDAEYAVRRTLSDKAETDEEAEAVCAALKVEGDAHEAMFDAVRAYKEASRG